MTPNPSRRPALAAILATTAMLVGAGWSASADDARTAARTSGARTVPLTNAQVGTLQLELIDQDYAFAVDATLRLVYRITGNPQAIAELVPPTAPPKSTIPPTIPPTSAPTIPPTPDAPPPPVEIPTTTIAPPIEFTVDVANYSPLNPLAANADYLDNILGRSERPTAFQRNIDGVGFADARQRIVVDADGVATLTLDIPTDLGGDDVVSGPDSLEFPDPGLYPLRVRLLVAGDVVAVHGTIVERLPGPDDRPGDDVPVNLAVIANVDRADGTERSQQDVDDQVDRVTTLGAAITSPILASIPPPVLAAAMAGDGADEVVAALGNDELVALTDIDLDVSSAVAADQNATFARRLRAGEEVLTDALPTTPSRRDVWIASEPLSGAGAQQLRDSGFRFVVMAPTLFEDTIGPDLPESDRFVEIDLPDGGALPVIIIDELSELLTDEGTADALRDATTTEWAIRTVTELVLDHRRRGASDQFSRILSTPTLDAPNPRLIAALETIAAKTPDVRFVSPSTLTGATDTQPSPSGDALTLPTNAGPDLTERLARIDDARLVLASAASMLSETNDRPARWADALEMLVSTGVTNAEADAVIDDVLLEAVAIREAVVLPDPFTFTMTSRSDEITLRLGNLSDQPLTVVVRLSSSKLTFPDNNRVVTLRADDSTDVVIPVRARSNGTSPVTVEVFTPLGEPIAEPVILTSRVNALTGLAQVLTGGFVLMLLSWWFTNWRNRRRQAPPGDEPPDDEPPGTQPTLDETTQRSGSGAK